MEDSGRVDPTERYIEQLLTDLAHERAVNAALVAALSGREPRVETPQSLEAEMADYDLKALARRSPTLSQVKSRAAATLERQRKEREAKSA